MLWRNHDASRITSYNVCYTKLLRAVKKSISELETLYNNSAKDSDAHIFLAQKALLLALCEKAESLEQFSEHINKEKDALRQGRHASKIADLNDLLYRVKTHLGYCYEVSLPKHPVITSYSIHYTKLYDAYGSPSDLM